VIRVGCAGWKIPRGDLARFASGATHLERYSRTFNCCEINSSFYRPHKYATWKRWAEVVPKDFRFSAKLPRTITHDVQLKCGPEELSAFLQQVRFMGDKLGAILIQLPPRGVFDHTIARRFFSLLREQHAGDVVLEARHSTWFDSKADDLLKKFRIAGVAADPACVPDASQPAGFGEVVYFRLHGSPKRYYSPYSGGFLKAKARQLASLAKEVRIWCIFDNTAAGFATHNALQLMEDLAEGEPHGLRK
jgi:uncharacterized protein YecE (DUF72 family)